MRTSSLFIQNYIGTFYSGLNFQEFSLPDNAYPSVKIRSEDPDPFSLEPAEGRMMRKMVYILVTY